jgi:hypothetical protein
VASGGGFVALPDGEEIALGVEEVGQPAHSWNWLLGHDDLAPQLLDPSDGVVVGLDAEGADQATCSGAWRAISPPPALASGSPVRNIQ